MVLKLIFFLVTGIRLYFVVSSQSVQQSKCRPDGLYLVHVRLPPGFTSSSVKRPASVHAANYQNGLLNICFLGTFKVTYRFN